MGLASSPLKAADGAGIVDVHHHLSPPDYVAKISRRTPLLPLVTGWTVQRSLADMDAAGVATALLSVTTPGLWFGDVAECRDLARSCNEYAADLVRDHKGRFGSFAALPMPNVDDTLKEIAYALDVLKADGVMLFTSYTQWLGDPRFAPVMDELNRRRAVVSVHPTTNDCCGNLIQGVPDTIVEYGTDTTRTIASLVFSGASRRYPDIRFVFSHAGGTAPFLIERFRVLAGSPAYQGKFPNGVEAELGRFFYDTAQASNFVAMDALRKIVPVQQIVFGTDFPYRTSAEHVNNLAALGYTPEDQRAITRGNAVRMMPQLA